MFSKDQEQNVAQGSAAIQVHGNFTITNGLTYSEVRSIVLDVFRENFYKLSEEAIKIARDRVEEITDKFLTKLQSENPNGLEKSNDPYFQEAIYTAQKHYATTGDKELGDVLVNLLVAISKQEQRSIEQIVLKECIAVASKLTSNQLAVLAVIFLFKHCTQNNIGDHNTFSQYLDKYVAPFLSEITKNPVCYQHLEYSGCGAIGIASISLESILVQRYQGLFLRGFDANEVADKGISIGLDSEFFINCLNDNAKIQVRALNEDLLNQRFETRSITLVDRKHIVDMFNVSKMNESEINDKCIQIRPYMANIFDTWSNSGMQYFTLTSVGISLGHARIKQIDKDFADLSIWIN